MHKARLVIKSCSQRKTFDIDKTFAPVARLTTARTLLLIINKEGLFANQMDIKYAFLHGYLKEDIYMKQPEGFIKDPTLVCKLNSSLYVLK